VFPGEQEGDEVGGAREHHEALGEKGGDHLPAIRSPSRLGIFSLGWAMELSRVTPQALKGLIEQKDRRIVIVDTRPKNA